MSAWARLIRMFDSTMRPCLGGWGKRRSVCGSATWAGGGGSNRVDPLAAFLYGNPAELPPGIDRPSDYDGIVYVPYDDAEGWQRKLVTELHAANVPVSQTW
jgi:hypothetical protein